MSRKAAEQLLRDLEAAGAFNPNPPMTKPVFLGRDDRYKRMGIVETTDETEKMEISGLVCGVVSETDTTARVYVIRDGKAEGPYTLDKKDVR